MDAAAKFCAECGGRLGSVAGAADAPAPQGAAPEAAVTERRVVSVLFADLVDFTGLAEGRDPEAVREILSRYFDTAREIVGRYGGTIEKFIGDAVMAVWGAPVAREDDAERAVRAGLDLVGSIRALGGDAGVDLRLRAGVLTGEAAVTVGATNQGLVAGDLVNTAARLQAAAVPESVLVGEETRRATAEAIAYEPAGDAVLKGKSAPVPAFRALRVVGKVGGIGRSEALEPPFVGRETEFRLLRELFHATGRDRKARLVSLSGQGGIGKSRLAWEFSKYIDGVVETVWWHHGRCPSYGDGISFWALGEMVRKRAGLAEGDDEAAVRAGIAAALALHVADPVERDFVEPTLLALLGLAEPPPGGRERLFAGWRTFFERIAEGGTVALVFEDLQWADDGLLDFIEHLLEWSRNFPIFILTLARPELLDRRPTWGGARSSTSLALSPLADDEMRALLAGLVPGLPDPAVRTILERADGIPLYAVETVRMLVADGRLAERDGVYVPVGDLGSFDVPGSLRALVAARLDGLAAEARAVVQDAAVLGQTFTVEALVAVSALERARAGAPAPRPGAPGGARAGHRPALSGTWAVRIRPGPPARGRLRDAGDARPAIPPPRRGTLLRGAWRRRARWRPGHPLHGRLPGGDSRARGRCQRDPGARSRCRPRPSAPRRWARRCRPSAISARPPRSPRRTAWRLRSWSGPAGSRSPPAATPTRSSC